MEELLFKNRTELSKQNYMILLKFHEQRNNWKYWAYTAFFSVVFLSYMIIQIINHSFIIAVLIFIFLLLFLGYRFLYPAYKVKKELNKEKIKNNMENCYLFYNKYFEITNENEDYKLRYHKINKIYENRNFFYLYLSKEDVLILNKSGFEIGNALEFKKFLKNKLKFKYKQAY